MENEAAERLASAAPQKPIYAVQNQRGKRKLTRRASSLPLFVSFLDENFVFKISLKNNRFIYVRRPLKFVHKQYHWFTHKNSISKSVTDIEKQISIKVLIPNSSREEKPGPPPSR